MAETSIKIGKTSFNLLAFAETKKEDYVKKIHKTLKTGVGPDEVWKQIQAGLKALKAEAKEEAKEEKKA